MNKPAQGASELHVQGVIAHYISQPRDLQIIRGKIQVSKATGVPRTGRAGSPLPRRLLGAHGVTLPTNTPTNRPHAADFPWATADFQLLEHRQITVEASVSPAFRSRKSSRHGCHYRAARVSQQHVQNIDFAQTTPSIA